MLGALPPQKIFKAILDIDDATRKPYRCSVVSVLVFDSKRSIEDVPRVTILRASRRNQRRRQRWGIENCPLDGDKVKYSGRPQLTTEHEADILHCRASNRDKMDI